MDPSEPLLTAEERESLRPQRPPERFAERVMGRVAAMRDGRRRRGRALAAAAAAATAAVVLAAGFALTMGRSAEHGEIVADGRTDVRVGPHVIAVLERGAHVTWSGDDVTQLAGDVFYRVEPGGARRVHTPAGEVTVRGTCFEVKVRGATEEGSDMTRRNLVSGAVGAVGAVGAIAGAAVLVGVYEGKVALSSGHASVELLSGQGATADGSGLHGPQDVGAAERAFEASAGEEPWRVANASLADQVKVYQRRLEDNEAQKKALEKELRLLKEKASASGPDGGGPRNPLDVDPRDLTQDDWKELARQGRVRTKFFCPPPGDWHTSAQQLTALGLSPDDAPALERAVRATQDRQWQAVAPECTKMLGNVELARRLGGEMCGMIIQMTAPKAEADADVQLVADIRAGNKPMPPPGQLDPLAARLLTLTGESATFERELAQDVGPEAAQRIARDEDQLGIGCGLDFMQGP